MNISSKISEISQAKKRRAALIFHSRRIEGIDVQPQNWVDTINLVKALFKELKKRRFGIDINHWGEIVLTEPERHIQVFLTAHQRLKPGIVEDIKHRLSHADYLIADDLYKARPVQLEFLANRLHAKRHALKCSLQAKLFNQDLCEMADQIMHSVAGLRDKARPLIYGDLMQITSEDILCVVRYGAIKLGPSSQLAYLIRDATLNCLPTLELNSKELIVTAVYQRRAYSLDEQSRKLLAMFFPKVMAEDISQ